MAVSGRSVTWSPQGWLLHSPGGSAASGGEQQKLTFAQISFAIMDTVKEAGKLKEDVTDAIEKNKLDEMIRQLRSAGAQYISAGQAYNSNPTPENNETMKNFDMIVGKLHTGLLRLMMQHSEGEFEVDPAQQRQYLLKEMNESLTEVREWIGQQEMMEIDAHAYYKAIDRLIRAYVSIIKNIITNRDKQVALAKQVQAWGRTATNYRDVFLPREEEKWKRIDTHTMEDNLFHELSEVHRAIEAAL